MAEGPRKTALVVSAHPGDFVWRAGGAIALYASRDWRVKIACLSFGERGESAKLWKENGMTLERVKTLRKDEALMAASVLGAEVEFLDCGDYPLNCNIDKLEHLADIYRSVQPEFVLTHSLEDPYNFDMLLDLTCVDYPQKENRFKMVYHLYSLIHNIRLRFKASLPSADPVIGSLTSLWKNANWLEREVFDMFGVKFDGHPDLRRIFMYDGFEGYPLRKDYPLRKEQPRIRLRK